jgi:hypothetical protein
MSNKTARVIRRLNENQVLVYLNEKLVSYKGVESHYVIVSESVVFSPETYGFISSEEGLILDYIELHMSTRGYCSWERCLTDAGYTILNK